MITVDDASLEMFGRWPWPRDYHGELVRILAQGEPAVIAFDLIFAEPSQDPMEDEYMVAMFESAGNIVLPVYGAFDNSSTRGMLIANEVIEPFPALKAVTQSGHINTIMDNDGIVRRTLLQFQHDNQLIDSFAWNIYQSYAKHTNIDTVDLSAIPVDPWHRTYIKYAGDPFAHEQIPYYMVMTGDVPAEYFRDKIVLVGPYTVGIADDYYFTPLAPQVPMFGMEIHANIIQQLLIGEFMGDVPLPLQILLMLIFGVICWYVFYKFRPSISGLLLLLLLSCFIAIAYIASTKGYIVTLIYTIVFIASQYVVSLGHQFVAEQLEKKRITDVFGKYVAPQIVGKILAEGETGLQLGGAKRDITVLFVDIRGFTPLSEAAEPEEVVAILNEYLTLCAQSIFDYDGTLDKFIGDATMAIYNAPFDVENHQLRAVQTAWAMAQGAVPLQKQLEERFGKTVRFGIGIHTGPAIIGNIGAKFRMDYTAIGDTVNTAARIESNTKPGQILISKEVYEKVKDDVEVLDLGVLQVKGKTQGIQVYQVENVKNMDKTIDKSDKSIDETIVNQEVLMNDVQSQTI
jgi:adenylate cyclase